MGLINWAHKILNRQANKKNFWGYDDITLKLYLDIANTGNLSLLAKKRVFIPIRTLVTLWEGIVKRNAEENNNLTYDYYHTLEENYCLLLVDYVSIKATISKLVIRYDEDDYNFLIEKGYRLPKFSTGLEFAEVLERASKKCEDLITKIKMNRLELGKLEIEGDAQPKTLQRLLSMVDVDLPFELREDITLAKYNEYKKRVKERKPRQPNG